MPKQIKRKVDLVTSVVALSIAIGILVLNAAGFIFKPSKPSEAAVVTATTEDPSNITPTSADLNGSTNSGANPAVTARGFQWGTDTNYGNTINDTNSSYVMAFNKKLTEYGAFGEPGKCEFVCRVATDNLGNIYTVYTSGLGSNVFVQKFNSTGQYLFSFKKSRPGDDPGNIGSVLGIAVDSSYNIYLFGTEGKLQERVIKKYDNAGNYLTSIGSQGSGPGQYLDAGALAIDSANNIYALDPTQDIVLKFNSKGVFQYSFGSTGSGPGQFETPWGIAVNSNGDIYVSDATLNRLQIFNNSGTLLNTLGSTGEGPGQFNTMGGVALDNLGNTYITDIGNNRAQKFDSSLVWQGNIGSNFMGQPYFIAANGSQIIIGNQNRNTEIYDQGNSFTDGSFSASLTGLTCGQTYHYRTFATNADGTSYGGDKTFSFDCGSVTTGSASNITNNSAALSGEVVSSPSAITAKGFEYGTSSNYGSSVNDSSLGTGNYSLDATGLQCNTTYYFRAYMTNSYGTQYGNQGTFTTTQCSQMQVTTINLPGLNPAFDSGNAILFGNVINSTSPITQVGFEWGTSTSYGNTVPGSGSTGPVTFINKFGGFGSGFGQFNLPNGLATDSENNIYVSDYYNNRVQKFNSAGVFQLSFGSLGAGIGEFNGPAKLAVDSGDNLYVVDSINQRVQKFSKFGVYQSQFGEFGGGDGQFSGPSGIAIDTSGDILVTDTSNTRVQKFNSAGVYQAQFGTSGSGNGEFDNPLAVTTDGSNNIYVADTNNNRIQKFNSSGVYQAQFGTSGTNDGQFNSPSGVKYDSITGQIFVADKYNNRIQIFDSSGNYINKFGEYGFNNTIFAGTSDVTTSANGNILVATGINGNDVQIFSNSSSINPGDFNAGLPGLTCGTTYHYRAYATNSEGSAYGSDVSFVACANISTLPPSSIKDNKASFNGTISAANDFITAQGFEWGTSTSYGNTINNTPNNNLLYQYNSQFGESGSGDGQFSNLVGLAKDSSNNTYVVDGGNNRIQKFNSAGVYLSQFGSFGSGDGQFIFPTAITIDSLGNIYVSDAGNNRVQKFNSAGVYVSQFGATGSGDGEFNQPFGLDIDKQGNIYVADSGNNRVQKFSSAGVYQAQFGTAGSGNGEFNNPVAVEVSILDIIYVSDQNNNRVNSYTSSGDYLGSISVNFPTGLTSNEQGIVMVASGGDNNIKLLDPQGNELIQFGSSGSGDGEFNFPSGIALDSSGNVYVGEYFGNRVQKFNLAPAFKFGSFNANIEGLSCDVTYHYRAFVTTSQGTFYGQDQTFTACLTMNTSPVSNATSNSGVLNGNVAATGNIVSRRGFEWGSSPSLGNTSFNTTGNNNANFIKAFGTLGADDGQFGYQSPFGTTFDSNGNLYATDYGNNRIQKFDENGNFISKFGSYGSGDGQFKSPTSVAIDKNNNIWVNDAGNSRIQLFDLNGDYVSQFPAGDTVRILSIKGDYAYVTGEGFVVKIDINTLTPVALIGTQGYGPGQWLSPVMATADNEGNVYVSDAGSDISSLLLNTSSKVLKYDSNGNFIKNIGGDAGQSSQIGIAYGINIDEFNNLYVTDALLSRIQRFDTDGNYINQIGIEGSILGLIGGFSPYYTSSSIDGQFLMPSFISSKNSSLYISDSFNSRIQKFELQQNFEPGSYNLTLEGLECGKQYYYRAVGTNQSGQNYYGNIESFKTTDCSPTPPTPTPTPTPSPISPTEPVEPPAPTNPEVAVQSAGETAKSANTPSRRSAPAIVVFAQEVDARLLAIARAVPREIAIAIPYAVISTLLGFAILYIVQSIRELRSINRYNSLIKKYENIQLGAKNFVALTNHYLNTPIGIITLSAEGLLASSIINKVQFSKIKAVGEDIKASINKLLKENNKATDEIIKSIESKKTTQKPIKVIMSPLLWLPIAISAGLVAFANLLFVRAGVFGISTINLTVQIVLFVLFVVFTALALKSFLRNRQVKKDRKEVLDEEKKLISLKEKFIDDTSETLEKDLDSLKMISAEFASKKEAVSYLRGIEMLAGVGTSFGLLKKFAVASPVSTVTSYDIKRISKKIVKHQNSAIKSKGLKVKLDIDKNIRVRLDKPGLVVLMGSLMNNAIKFSSPKQDIIVIAKKVGTNVVIEIKDRGEIIEKDKLEILMTPFARTTDALKYDYEGLGLGLYMDRIIAEQAGGSIEITSSNQKGTVAKIKLPFANNS